MWWVLFLLCLILLIKPGRYWWQRRKKLVACGEVIPGPKPLPVIGNTVLLGASMNDIFQKCEDLYYTYGGLFRVWMGSELMVIIGNARDAEVILSSSKYIEKSFLYGFLHPWLGTGLLTSTDEKWQKHRKIITPTFHFKILENFIHIFVKNGDILVSKLKERVDEPPFGITNLIDHYTQDIISESAMGVELNAQTQEEGVSEYLYAVRREAELFIERFTRPWLYLDATYQLSSLGRESKRNLKILHGMTKKVIKERKKLFGKDMDKINQEGFIDELGKKKRFAFLDLLLLSAENGKVLSDNDIREEVDTFMFEGHDTTSSALCFALYELSRSRDIQEKIYEEILGVFGDDFTLTIETLGDLKYTEMVIKETLRIYPSVPIMSRKLHEDMKLATLDVVVPSGVTVMVTPYGIHMDPEWYPEPKKFDPDRFQLDAIQGRHPFAFVPFSAGPRNCIGQKFAMLELKSTIAKIIWNFILEPSPEYTPHIVSGLTMKAEKGIELKVTLRKK